MATAPHHYKFQITMSCSGCSGAIERVLKKLEGSFLLSPLLLCLPAFPHPPPLLLLLPLCFPPCLLPTPHPPSPRPPRLHPPHQTYTKTHTLNIIPPKTNRHPILHRIPRSAKRRHLRRGRTRVRDGAGEDPEDGQDGRERGEGWG